MEETVVVSKVPQIISDLLPHETAALLAEGPMAEAVQKPFDAGLIFVAQRLEEIIYPSLHLSREGKEKIEGWVLEALTIADAVAIEEIKGQRRVNPALIEIIAETALRHLPDRSEAHVSYAHAIRQKLKKTADQKPSAKPEGAWAVSPPGQPSRRPTPQVSLGNGRLLLAELTN